MSDKIRIVDRRTGSTFVNRKSPSPSCGVHLRQSVCSARRTAFVHSVLCRRVRRRSRRRETGSDHAGLNQGIKNLLLTVEPDLEALNDYLLVYSVAVSLFQFVCLLLGCYHFMTNMYKVRTQNKNCGVVGFTRKDQV